MDRHVLGVSAFFHDSAAALVTDGRIVAAAQEERFSRRKGEARFPTSAAARPELVVLCGLQASGKTTFFEQMYAATHEPVSKDRMPNNRRKEARQRELISAALAAGRSVVVDNTNPTRADREPLIALGRSFGAWVVGCWFPTDVQAATRRNAHRTGRAKVPVVGILATAKRLEPPTLDEGYDVLITVELATDGFSVAQCRPDR